MGALARLGAGGDFILALSGAFRMTMPLFVALATVAKTARYTVIALIGLGIQG
ncbi:MAG: hypothetical protein ACK4GC_11275 [Paracoccaceae bacterium]